MSGWRPMDFADAPWPAHEIWDRDDIADIEALRDALLAERRTYEAIRLRLVARHGAEKLQQLCNWAYALLTGWAFIEHKKTKGTKGK